MVFDSAVLLRCASTYHRIIFLVNTVAPWERIVYLRKVIVANVQSIALEPLEKLDHAPFQFLPEMRDIPRGMYVGQGYAKIVGCRSRPEVLHQREGGIEHQIARPSAQAQIAIGLSRSGHSTTLKEDLPDHSLSTPKVVRRNRFGYRVGR